MTCTRDAMGTCGVDAISLIRIDGVMHSYINPFLASVGLVQLLARCLHIVAGGAIC